LIPSNSGVKALDPFCSVEGCFFISSNHGVTKSGNSAGCSAVSIFVLSGWNLVLASSHQQHPRSFTIVGKGGDDDDSRGESVTGG
jgi:hypothetical protein